MRAVKNLQRKKKKVFGNYKHCIKSETGAAEGLRNLKSTA